MEGRGRLGNRDNPFWKAWAMITAVIMMGTFLTIFSANIVKAPVIFEDSMEPAEDPGWTHASVGGGGIDLWHVTTIDSYSPPNSWWCGKESTGDYNDADDDGISGEYPDDCLNDALFTPIMDLSTYENVEFSFMESYETEGSIYDQCWVELSTDGGSTWPTVLLDGFTRTGSNSGWQQMRLPVPKPFTTTMQIRFRFDTIDGRNNNYPGWFIDDVYIGSYKFIYQDQEKYGLPSTDVSYTLTINNSQSFPDSFDLNFTSPSGWIYTFYEADGLTPLTDTNGDLEGLPNTPIIPTQTTFTIVVKVTVPPAVPSAYVEIGTVKAISFFDSAFDDSVTLTTTIDFAPPCFGDPSTDPPNPNATVDVNASIPITDDVTLDNAILYYSYDGNSWTPIDMNLPSGQDAYAEIPGPGFPTTVYYYINATDEAGNLNHSSPHSYFAGSDLVLNSENITLRPYPLEQGYEVTIEANVFNLYGPLENIEVRFYLGDPDIDNDNIIDGTAMEIGTPSIIDVGSFESNLATTTWTTSIIGDYEIYAWVDADNSTWESDEWNNLASQTLPIFHWVDSFDNLTKTQSRVNITYEDGDALIFKNVNYDFDESDEEFSVEIDYPNSQVYWDAPNKNVYVRSDRQDSGDELFTKSLPSTFTSDTHSWTLTARWKATQRGHWQAAFPIFITDASTNDIDTNPNTIYICHGSGDKYTNNPPFNYRVIYKAGDGVEYLNERYVAQLNVQYHFYFSYDAFSKNLTLEVRDVNDVTLFAHWYIIGTNPGDDFTLGKIGVGSHGKSDSAESDIVGWTDDISLTITTGVTGNLTSIPITLPPGQKWGALYINKTEPTNTYINVTIIDAATGLPIPGFTRLRGEYIDISGIDSITYPSIKLFANFTGNETTSPILHYWAVNRNITLFSIPLFKGWNMISLPLNQSTAELESIFANLDYIAVRCYKSSDTNDPWKQLHKDKIGLNDLSEVDKRMGIWTLMAQNDMLIISGNTPTPTNIQLKKGWNLVGYPSLTSRLVINALSGIPYDVVMQYNASQVIIDPWKSTRDGDLTVMRPGEGYWVHVKSDCTWSVDW